MSRDYETSKKIAEMILGLDSAIFDGIIKAIPDDYRVYTETDEPISKWDIAYLWLLERIDCINKE